MANYLTVEDPRLVYNLADKAYNSYPIGQNVIVKEQFTNYERNQSVAIRYASGNNYHFVSLELAGTALSGTWRCNGVLQGDVMYGLFTRTA